MACPIPTHPLARHCGLTLVELMIGMAIGLLVVAVVTALYVHTQQSQRMLDRQSQSRETGAFVLELLGREIGNAGFYPSHFLPVASDPTQAGMYDTYPPLETPVSNPVNRISTDWQNSSTGWPPLAYQTGVYGCEGGEFNVQSASCPTPDLSQPDSLVINYFTGDVTLAASGRHDCTRSSIENDTSNTNRFDATKSKTTPPVQPLFVSNRYTLKSTKQQVDGADHTTLSFACSGNGANPWGTVSAYQPIVSGLKALRFSYGVHSGQGGREPQKFYTATEVSAMPAVQVMGESLTGWQRVTAIRVCVLSQTLGGGTRLEDTAGKEKTYLDCSDTSQPQPAGQMIERFVQVFGVRNGLTHSY